MAYEIDNVDIKALRRLYNKEECARCLFDYLASRKYNSVETTVDRLEVILSREDADCSRREVVSAMKKLERYGCGTFVIGRRGQPSRFAWGVQMVEVGRAAKGEESLVRALNMEEAKPEEDEESELATNAVRHVFKLRPDYTVRFELPSDFSTREATRLAEFVKTLPFEEKNEV